MCGLPYWNLLRIGFTTGFRFFAECLRHLAKAKLHSAKPLPSAVLSKEHMAKKLIGKVLFAECLLSGTRQRLCREPRGHSAKKSNRHGAGAPGALGKEKRPSRRRPRWWSLCRVPTLQALSKDFLFFKKKIFAECPLSGPRQRCFIFFLKILCRVPPGRRSAKFDFFLKKIFAECPLAGTRQSLIFF